MREKSHGVLVNLCLTSEYIKLADGRVDGDPTKNLIVGAIHHLVPDN